MITRNNYSQIQQDGTIKATKPVGLSTALKLFVLLTLLLLIGCQSEKEQRIAELTQQHPIEYFKDSSTQFPVIDRIQPIPWFLRAKWQILDKRKDYTPYAPTENDIQAVLDCIELLPKHLRELLENKVVGIYFVDNFMGSGLTDWIPMPDGTNRYYILFNSDVLNKGMAAGLTYKENTAFIDDGSLQIEYYASKDYPYLLYILVHELYHILDYEYNYTPYVDKTVRKHQQVPESTLFTKDVWKDYETPIEKFDFALRENISFYGLGEKTDKLEAIKIYDRLMQTPFVSLYSSLSWAEDFAEYMTFHFLNEQLGIQFEIRILENESVIANYQPINEYFKNRISPVNRIYGNSEKTNQ